MLCQRGGLHAWIYQQRFCNHCNETALLLQPLKGLPTPNDLEPRGRGSGLKLSFGHRVKKLQDKYAIHQFIYTPLVCQHNLVLFVSTVNTCTFGRRACTGTCTQVNTSNFTILNSRLLSPSKAYQSICRANSLSHVHCQTHTANTQSHILADQVPDNCLIARHFILSRYYFHLGYLMSAVRCIWQ